MNLLYRSEKKAVVTGRGVKLGCHGSDRRVPGKEFRTRCSLLLSACFVSTKEQIIYSRTKKDRTTSSDPKTSCLDDNLFLAGAALSLQIVLTDDGSQLPGRDQLLLESLEDLVNDLKKGALPNFLGHLPLSLGEAFVRLLD